MWSVLGQCPWRHCGCVGSCWRWSFRHFWSILPFRTGMTRSTLRWRVLYVLHIDSIRFIPLYVCRWPLVAVATLIMKVQSTMVSDGTKYRLDSLTQTQEFQAPQNVMLTNLGPIKPLQNCPIWMWLLRQTALTFKAAGNKAGTVKQHMLVMLFTGSNARTRLSAGGWGTIYEEILTVLVPQWWELFTPWWKLCIELTLQANFFWRWLIA